jgi:hypothetical protein
MQSGVRLRTPADVVQGKVVIDLLVLDLTHQNMMGSGPGIVCDGSVCEDAMRARDCLSYEVADAGSWVLLVRVHVLATPLYLESYERLQGNEAYLWYEQSVGWYNIGR